MEKKDNQGMCGLLARKEIAVTFTGSGRPTGAIGTLSVENKTENELTFAIPRGFAIVTPGSGSQNMVQGTAIPVTLGPGERREIPLDDGFCNDDYSTPPPTGPQEGATFLAGKETEAERDLIDTVERNLEEGSYHATRLMKKDKARQTLIQWTLWRRARPETFDKDRARKIIFAQLSGRKRPPPASAVEEGVDMLFEDVDLTMKETPSAAAPPAGAAAGPAGPCACTGSVTPAENHSEPDIKVSEHYRDEEDRARIREAITSALARGESAAVTPATAAAFSRSGAAVGCYGDARAAYLFLERPGSFYEAHHLDRTERLTVGAEGETTATVAVEHAEREGCAYESVVGAAAIAILGASASAYDPLEGTEGGFRLFEHLYDISKEAVKQEWITSIFDAIKDATTNYDVSVGCESRIRAQVGPNSNTAVTAVRARMKREGSDLLTPRTELADVDAAHATASACMRGDRLSLRFEGETAADIAADDGGRGVVGQESLIGYVWYWACKTIEGGEEKVDARWGHDWAFATVDEERVDAVAALRESNTAHRIDGLLDATVGTAAHEDPFDCGAIRTALEEALYRWITALGEDIGAYASVADELSRRHT